jgi:hypothetical protein
MEATILRIISELLILISLFFIYLWAKNNKENWLVSIPAIIWLIHGLIHYGYAVILWCTNPAEINNPLLILWGTSVRTHGYLTTAIMAIFLYYYFRKFKNGR